MKRWRMACAVICLLALLMAVAAAASSTSLFEKIRAQGKITIGLNADYPPFCLWHNGRPQGFDVELATEIARRLGLDPIKDVTFVPVGPAEAVVALTEGRIDLAVAALTVTADRARQVAFSKPYYVATLAGLLTRNKIPQIQEENIVRPLPLHSVNDLRKIEPLVVAVKRGTAVEKRTADLLKSSRVVGFATMREALDAMVAGRADALVHEDPYIRHLQAGRFGGYGRFVAITDPVTKERLAIACRQGDPDFVNWLNVVLDELADAGLLAKWEKQYFESAAWRKEVPW